MKTSQGTAVSGEGINLRRPSPASQITHHYVWHHSVPPSDSRWLENEKSNHFRIDHPARRFCHLLVSFLIKAISCINLSFDRRRLDFEMRVWMVKMEDWDGGQDIVIKETEGNTLYQRQRLGLHNGGPIKSLIIDRRILGLQEVAVRLLKKINSLTCKLGMVHILLVAQN